VLTFIRLGIFNGARLRQIFEQGFCWNNKSTVFGLFVLAGKPRRGEQGAYP
jgi:hypothetical protein